MLRAGNPGCNALQATEGAVIAAKGGGPGVRLRKAGPPVERELREAGREAGDGSIQASMSRERRRWRGGGQRERRTSDTEP